MARPRIPKYTRINGEKWRVVPKRVVKLDGEEVEGACHFDTRVIEISVESDDEIHILQNFWHEVAHALFHASGVQSISDDAEHAVVKVIENYLAANVDFRPLPRKSRRHGRT